MTLKLAERTDERLGALERLEVLCDPGSIQLVRTQVRSRRMGEKEAAAFHRWLKERARDGDMVITMGAGSVYKAGEEFVRHLRK